MKIKTNEDYIIFREAYIHQPHEKRLQMRMELSDCLYNEIRLQAYSIIGKNGGKEQPSSVTDNVWLKFFTFRSQDIIEQCDHLIDLKRYLFRMVSNVYFDKIRATQKIHNISFDFHVANAESSDGMDNVSSLSDPLLFELTEDINTILKKHLSEEEIFLLMTLLYKDELKYSQIQPLLEGQPSPDAIGQRVRKLLGKLGNIEDLRLIYENMGE